jgi:hypothetical protein
VTVIGILIYNAFEENQQSNPSTIVNTEEPTPNDEVIIQHISENEEIDQELNSETVESNLIPEDEKSEIAGEVLNEEITTKNDI